MVTWCSERCSEVRWSVHVSGQPAKSLVKASLGYFGPPMNHLNSLGTGLDTFEV